MFAPLEEEKSFPGDSDQIDQIGASSNEQGLTQNEIKYSHQKERRNRPLKSMNMRRKVIVSLWSLIIIGLCLGISYKSQFTKGPTLNKVNDPLPEFMEGPATKIKRKPTQSLLRTLCKVASSKASLPYCHSYTVADVIDLAWAVAPLYSCRGGGPVEEKLYDLHKNFIGYLNAYGIPSITIEAIKLNSNQTYKVARPNMEPYEMQSYYHNCSYLRENLLNMAIRKLELPWEYVMWIDAHQIFENPLWIFEAIVLAEKYAVVQLFKSTLRLDERNQSDIWKRGFMFNTFQEDFYGGFLIEFGNAMFLRRELYEKIEYIIDDCIADDCDVTYCRAVWPQYYWFSDDFYPRYSEGVYDWLNRTKKIFNESRTYINNQMIHFYHQTGTFPYLPLHQILEWLKFDKDRDVKRDENFAVYIANETIARAVEKVLLTDGRIYDLTHKEKEKTI